MTHFHLAGVLLGTALITAVLDLSPARAFLGAGLGVLILALYARADR